MFFRMVALSLEKTLAQEKSLLRDSPKKIGKDLIRK